MCATKISLDKRPGLSVNDNKQYIYCCFTRDSISFSEIIPCVCDYVSFTLRTIVKRIMSCDFMEKKIYVYINFIHSIVE